MSMKFSLFVFLTILVVCQTKPTYHYYNDDDAEKDDGDRHHIDHNRFNEGKKLNSEQLNKLYEYFSLNMDEEPTYMESDHRMDYPYSHYMTKRDALWTTTEVLECVRRLRYARNNSKLDLVTEMLNCYRRLRRQG